MSATYDPTLSTDRDWVRFLIRDTDTTTAMMSDEEIDGVLTEELLVSTSPAARYFAAATILEALHAGWMSRGRGVASKKTAKLAITFGTGVGINVDAAVQATIKQLRLRGAHLLCPAPRTLKIL